MHDPDAAVAVKSGIGHVEAVDEYLSRVVAAVAFGGFVYGDKVHAAIVVRWGGWDLVVVGAVVLVAAQHGETGRVGILARVGDPEAASLVEAEIKRLRDLGLGEDELGLEIGGGGNLGGGLGGSEAWTGNLFGAAEDAIGLAEGVEGGGGGFVLEGGAGSVGLAGAEFPRTGKHTLPEIIHDEGRVAEET